MKTRHIFHAILFSLIFISGILTADANASAAPSLHAVADSGSQITLDWIDGNKWVSGYKIERRQSREEAFVLIAETGKVRTYTDTFELSPETTYEYKVRAIKKRGKVEYNLYFLLAGVTTLAAEAECGDNCVGEGKAGGPSCGDMIVGNTPGETCDPPSTPGDGVVGRYECRADCTFCGDGIKDAVEECDPNDPNPDAPLCDNSCQLVPAPTVPQNLVATPDSCSQISMSWEPSTDTGGSGLKGYDVYRGGTYLKQVPAPATSTIDSGLAGSTNYSYNVKAVDNEGVQSAMSNTAVTNTPSCQVCGDGTLDAGEECDDGNTINGDGCSSVCTIEVGSGTGAYHWADIYGDSKEDVGQKLTLDDSGNIILTGYFEQTLNLGGATMSSAGAKDIFLAKFSPSGSHLWSKRFGGVSQDEPTDVATDAAGNVFLTGYFHSVINFGGGSLTSAGQQDFFIVKFSPTGAHVWSKRFGNTGIDSPPRGMDVDNSGNIIITGNFKGSLNLGGGSMTSAGNSDIYVAKFTTAGVNQLSENFTGTLSSYDLAVDNSNNILLTGSFQGTINLGGQQLTSSGASDIFVAKYSISGSQLNLLWAKGFGGTGFDKGQAIAVDTANNVALSGYIKSAVNFGGGPVTFFGEADIFVAKLSGTNGAHLWSRSCGGWSVDYGYGIATDGTDVLVTGTFSYEADFGDGQVFSTAGMDLFVARYAGNDGSHVWSYTAGGTGDDKAYTIDVNDLGNSIVSGGFRSTSINFGDGFMFGGGRNDIFLLELGP